MKNYMIAFGLSIFLLTGCQTETTSDPEEQPVVEVDEPTIQDEKNEDIDQSEGEDVASTEIEEPSEAEEEQEPTYEINQGNWTIEPIEDGEEQVVLLTIDDAPDEHAVEMAETLKQLEVEAIFFVNGHFLESDEGKEKLKVIHELGFEIGNHTMTHPNLGEISDEEQRTEIVQVNDLVEEVTGERPRFFRAPFGLNTDTSRQVIDDENMTAMNWTYGYDWEKEYQNAEALTEIMVNSPFLTNGANLLMHDRTWTAKSLEDIVKGLKEKGYSFVEPNEIRSE